MYIPEPRVVVVGYDGSPNSRIALRRAAIEARQRHARLDVIYVIPRRRGWWQVAAAWLRLRRAVARAIPRSQHVTTRLRISYGRPGDVLPRAAAKADLLAIGARSSAQHPFGGETVPAVLSSSRCDVMICNSRPGRSTAATAAER